MYNNIDVLFNIQNFNNINVQNGRLLNVDPDHNHDFQLPNCINVDPIDLSINQLSATTFSCLSLNIIFFSKETFSDTANRNHRLYSPFSY